MKSCGGEEFHLLTALGMSPLDALRAGTSVDAELLVFKIAWAVSRSASSPTFRWQLPELLNLY